jgi:amino acid transporter
MKKLPVIIVLFTIITAILVPVVAFADGQNRLVAAVQLDSNYRPDFAANIEVGNKAESYQTGNLILQLIASSLIYVAGPVAVLMIAVGGFRYVIAHGEQAQMEEAKKNITWAIIGLLIIILSYAIVENVIKISAPEGSSSGSGQTTAPAAPNPADEGKAEGASPTADNATK